MRDILEAVVSLMFMTVTVIFLIKFGIWFWNIFPF